MTEKPIHISTNRTTGNIIQARFEHEHKGLSLDPKGNAKTIWGGPDPQEFTHLHRAAKAHYDRIN